MEDTDDRLLNRLLTSFFTEFIELFLPDLAEHLDREDIILFSQRAFDSTEMAERCQNDVLAQVALQGQYACILIHITSQPEHQEDFERWMFGYFLKLYCESLIPVYPIALFSFDEPLRSQSQRHEVSFSDFKVVEFNFTSIQLNSLNWRDYLHHRNPIAIALMSRMQVAPEDRTTVKAECLRLLETLQLAPTEKNLIVKFVSKSLNLSAEKNVL
jgi:hypothetical protein